MSNKKNKSPDAIFKHQDELLDAAIAESMIASDSVTVFQVHKADSEERRTKNEQKGNTTQPKKKS